MPTMDDLAKLASQLYNGNPSIGASQRVDNLQWDQDAATALGFTSPNFWVWSGEEYKSDYAYYRYFYSTGSYYNNGLRWVTSNQAVCIAD